MTVYRNYLSVLEKGVASYATSPLLKIPYFSQDGSEFKGWKDVTYRQFQKDVETAARYWYRKLPEAGLSERSVVGLWLKGTSYLDLLHIWGIIRAGFIPQMISLRMTNPQVVCELLQKANAAALLCEPTFQHMLTNSPFPVFHAGEFESARDESSPLPKVWTPTSGEDITMILHSSGSTAGIPKLVPCTAKWIDIHIAKLRDLAPWNGRGGQQERIVGGGSFCHLASMSIFVCYMDRGGAYVLPTSVPYPSSLLKRMVEECGLTNLFMFSSFMAKLLQEARNDESLLKILQGMSYIAFGGLPLGSAEEAWARSQGITILNTFASTEIGMIAQSVGERGLLEPFAGAAYEFVPVSDTGDEEDMADGKPLLELVVPPESPDCPAPALRDERDGKFHSGDLFVEVEPGRYLSKGRHDDWIKMEISLRCDTRSIEDSACETCKDLISVASVVGSGRPSPVLIVEPAEGVKIDTKEEQKNLKDEILRRITPFHGRRYVHERIDSTRYIFIVPRGKLPRTMTKGNVQRRMVERGFEGELNKVFQQ